MSLAIHSHREGVADQAGDLNEHSYNSQVSEEDEGRWLIHRLPERNRPYDLTEDEEEEEMDTNEPMELSDSFLWGAGDPRDRQHRTEAPEPRQAEERDVSWVGGCHGNHSEEEVAAVQISKDSLGESHKEGLLGNALPAQPADLLLSPSPPAGGAQHFLGSFNSSTVHPHLTNSPRFESDPFAESQPVLETQVELRHGQRNHDPRGGYSPDSEGEESQDRSDFTLAACSLQARRVLTQDIGQVEGEDEEVEVRPEGPGCFHSVSPLPRRPKMAHRVPHDPPPSALQSTRKAWQSPSDLAPCLRVPKNQKTSTRESPKRGCNHDTSRYGKGPLNHPLPDLSKVEPRVHFPKEGYKPPKSKGCPWKKSPPLVFMSPANIVREVLLSSTDTPLTSAGPQRSLNATVPQEFRSPKQASMLVHQLQEDYNRLLTKYAEAENTIDRLRLEAKVNLYSDPPNPSHPDYTGTLNMGLKVMTITLPRAQRAQLDPIAVSTGTDPEKETTAETGDSPTVPSTSAYTPNCSLGPRFGKCLTEALSRQLQMQVDSFEELLKGGRLKPCEQVLKGLSCLAQGQGSLERGYLRAREEHRLQQQQGRNPGPFDPHRELEGEIFHLGMRLEELKEQVQPGAQVQPVSTAPPLTPLRTDCSTASAPYPHPESQLSPAGGGARVLMGMPVSLASGEKEGEDEDEGEMDEKRPFPLPCEPAYQHGENDLSHLPQQVPQRTREDILGPSPSCSQLEPLQLWPTFPRRQSQDTNWGGVRSRSGSPASAGESAAFEGQAPKPQSGLRKAPPQDEAMSPQTDSGFVGSQSSHLNLVAPSPAQQEAITSQSSTLEGGDKMLPVSIRPRLGSACQGLASPNHSMAVANNPEVQPSAEKRGTAPPSSPRHWPSSSTSQFESSSDHSHSSSEHEEESQTVRHTQPFNRSPRHQRRPSQTGLCRHGDLFGVLDCDQPAERHKALQSLQAEMSRLKEQLEGSLWMGKSSYPITVPPLVQEDPLHSQHSSTQCPRSSECQEDERREEVGEQEGEGEGREQAPYKRSSPVPRLRPELDIITDSQHSQPSSKPQSYRRIPESSGAQRRQRRTWRRLEERTAPVEHRLPHTGHQHSMAASGDHDEVKQRQSRSRSDHTPNDITANPTGLRTAGGLTSPRHTCPHSGCCARCRCWSRSRDRADSDGLSMHRTSGSTHQNAQPLGFTHRGDGGVFFIAPPPPVLGHVPLVQFVPVCPSVLYCSAPTSGAPPASPRPLHLHRGGQGARRPGGALPADREPLSDSLTRAIEAARRMRAASGRMARSLSAGIRHQGALSLS